MSARGRRAARPEHDHHRPEVLAAGSLRVEHRDRQGVRRTYDFSNLPVSAAMQRSWAVLFAARCAPGGGWNSCETSKQSWSHLVAFARFLARLDAPPGDVSEMTVGVWAAWRLSQSPTPAGYGAITVIARLLKRDPRLPAVVRDAMAKRETVRKGSAKAFSPDEFAQVRAAARRTVRAAHQRIIQNLAHLRAWREGEFEPGSADWLIGEALDVIATTGHAPHYLDDRGRIRVVNRYARALGGARGDFTWKRLYLSREEAAALAVLIATVFGLNATTVSELPAPRATPDSGEGGLATYRLEIEKRRRGAEHNFETRNVTDTGGDSPGRLIRQALEATGPARAFAAAAGSGTDRLLIWHEANSGPARRLSDEIVRIGPFGLGIDTHSVGAWARRSSLSGSPMRRTRKTVNVLHRREPGQNSQDTHDSVYVMNEPQAQQAAIPVIADGVLSAVEAARSTVIARLTATRDPGDQETATADCHDFYNSPFTSVGLGCSASFLLCLACPNARVAPDHHPRLAHLHSALENLRGVLEPELFDVNWGQGHARLSDLKTRLGPAQWRSALENVTRADRDLIEHLMNGHFDA